MLFFMQERTKGEYEMLSDLFNQNKRKYLRVPQEGNGATGEEGLLEKCPKCKGVHTKKEIQEHLYTCPACGHHFAIRASERLISLVDEDSFVELDETLRSSDPLAFPDYAEKLSADQEKTGMNDAVLTGKATLNHIPFIVGIFEAGFRMGSMGSVVGEKLTRAIEEATEQQIPFVLFSASGGARMQEGVLSLMQMGKTSAALAALDEAGGLFISVLTNPTTGGVSASFASLGDVNLAEPQALIGFAGRRIIEQTIREKLPKDFQSAEFQMAHGQLDAIVDRKQMKDTIGDLFLLHGYGEDSDVE